MKPSRWIIVLVALSAPTAAAAQQVQGQVVDEGDGSPVAGATVTLADSAGAPIRRVIADDHGRFWLWHAEAGDFRLSAERIGYATVEGHPVHVDSAEVVEVVIRMKTEAVPVEPLKVVARRHVERFTPDEFYDRMSRLGDRGTFITRERIEETGARLPSLAIAWAPGTVIRPSGRSVFNNSINLVSYGRRCSPAMYLNGRELQPWETLDELVLVDRIEGIEVYRGEYTPDNYINIDHHTCGIILVWTKTDPDPRFAFSWGRTILFGVLGAVVLSVPLLLF